MNTSFTADIESYLKHDDVSLAVRRTLDMTLDTGDATLVQRSIDWSKQFRQEEAKGLTVKMPAAFFEEARSILNTAAKLNSGKMVAASDLLEAKKQNLLN